MGIPSSNKNASFQKRNNNLISWCQAPGFLPLELSKAQPTQFRLARRDCAEHNILIFNGHILAYFYGADEDMGQDDSEMFLCLKAVVLIENNIMARELLEVASWLQRAFSF